MARADWTHFWLCVGGCCSARVRGVARGRELGLQNQLVRPAVTIWPYAFAGVRNLLWWTLDNDRSQVWPLRNAGFRMDTFGALCVALEECEKEYEKNVYDIEGGRCAWRGGC